MAGSPASRTAPARKGAGALRPKRSRVFDERYSWVDGCRLPKDKAPQAGIVWRELQDRHPDQPVTAEEFLDHARRKRSPVHDLFIWNDREAAEIQRVDQAQYVLRSLKVEIVQDEKVIYEGRKLVHLPKRGGRDGGYHDVMQVAVDDELRAESLQQALDAAEAYMERYNRFSKELGSLFRVMKKEIEALRKKTTKKKSSKRSRKAN